MANGDAQRPKSEAIKPSDAFWLTDLYPDSAALFQHQQKSLADISATCIVALDANVLLWPLELNAASVEDIAKVYKDLGAAERLVVPGQAAREFYKHRSRKVAALTEAIDGAIQKTRKAPLENAIPILTNDADYKKAQEINVKIVNLGKEMEKHLAAASQRLKGEVGSDRVSTIYRGMLSHCVVDISYEPDDRKALIEEADRRARLQIAPGYKDQNKDDGGIGDLIIWKTILKEAAARKLDCIFVTNEEKPDWWIRSRGTFQPRPELIEEYRQHSEGGSIHFLPLSGLLANYKAPKQTVSEVQKLEEEKRERNTETDVVGVDKVAIRLTKKAAEKLELHRKYTEQIQYLEERIRDVRERIDNDDPAAVPEEYWKLLSSLEAERSNLVDQLNNYGLNRILWGHSQLSQVRDIRSA